MKRISVTVLCLLVAPAAHALVQTKHQTVTATECARAGLPSKFCQEVAVEAYNTDANEFEDLSAHAQIPVGATACDAADQSLLRLLSLGQELRLGLAELRRTGSATAAGRVARALGRGLHTVQDNCAHNGMPNPQHAWFSLSDSCRATTVSPDVQSDAYVCAARETAAVMAEFRRAADGAGAGVTAALGRASVGGTHWPPYSQVCDFLGSSGQWSGGDQRWENEIVVPALRAQLIAAIGSDGPSPVEACPGGRERLGLRQSRAALDTSGGAQSCVKIHLFCLGKADDAEAAGEPMPPWESAETVAQANAEVVLTTTGSDGTGSDAAGCSLAGSGSDGSAAPLALLAVAVAALLFRRRLAALLVSALIGCAAPPSAGETEAALSSGPSPVSQLVLAALDATGADRHGRTWNVTTDNHLDEGWLLQTPPESHWGHGYAELAMPVTCTGTTNCDPDFQLERCRVSSDCGAGGRCAPVAATVSAPGQLAQSLCVGHSDAIVDEMYRVVTSAERFADVTSLQPPDGRFTAALRNAITFLSRSGRTVEVRLLFGAFPVQGVVNSKAVLQSLTRDVAAASPIRVYVGNYRSSDAPPSWNHSKIVAADGKVAIVGGHNLWTQHYLGKNPVHDVSMRVRGTAAADAHRFANEQWRWTCDNRSALTYLTWSVWANSFVAGRIGNDCPAPYALPDNVSPAGATVFAVGRLAGIDGSGKSNQSDTAILAMLDGARTTIRLSLQDLGPPTAPLLGIPLGSWPDALFAKLGAALVRNVDVYLVLSNPGSVAGGLSSTEAPYSNGWSLADVTRHLRDAMRTLPGAPSGAALDALVCRHLHVAPLRFSSESRFPDGVAYPNHAKFAMVDEQAFYLGSQNLYNAGLTEYGYLVDDATAAADARRVYWDHLWQFAGSAIQECVLR